MLRMMLLSLFFVETSAFMICTMNGKTEQFEARTPLTKLDLEELVRNSNTFQAPDAIPGIRTKVNSH